MSWMYSLCTQKGPSKWNDYIFYDLIIITGALLCKQNVEVEHIYTYNNNT